MLLEPPRNSSPRIDADYALALGWGHGLTFGGSSIQAVHALLPAGGTFSHDTDVWVVKIRGACIENFGFGGGCDPGTWNVLIDASTGDFILAFGSVD